MMVDERICEICKERPGLIHLTEIIKRKKTETRLCSTCMDQRVEDQKVIAALAPKPTPPIISELVAAVQEQRERAERAEALLPDHCYGCDQPCRYAGNEKRTGAARCAECLLTEHKRENRAESALIEKLSKRAAFLESIIKGFACSRRGSFHHSPEQWRMCQACSARKGLR